MRFEFSIRDVLQLVHLIYALLNMKGIDEMMYLEIATLINKVKDYGIDAFDNREKYRYTIASLRQKLVAIGKTLGLSTKGEI